MGFLLKIVLFGVAVYGVWKTFRYWKSMFDRFTGKPEVPQQRPPAPRPDPRPEPPPAASRRVIVEDTVQCPGCGAYISTAAEKCGNCGRDRP